MNKSLETQKDYEKSWESVGMINHSSDFGFYNEELSRKKIDGGWIYRLQTVRKDSVCESITFVPDDKDWHLK